MGSCSPSQQSRTGAIVGAIVLTTSGCTGRPEHELYEICLRHVTGKPTVHLIQVSDPIPFDLGNFRTIKMDTNDKYKMVSELDTLRSEISTAMKLALANGESRDHPVLTYHPNAKFVLNDST